MAYKKHMIVINEKGFKVTTVCDLCRYFIDSGIGRKGVRIVDRVDVKLRTSTPAPPVVAFRANKVEPPHILYRVSETALPVPCQSMHEHKSNITRTFVHAMHINGAGGLNSGEKNYNDCS